MCNQFLPAHQTNQSIKTLKVDGGVSQNNWVMQNLSDQIGISVERLSNIEASSVGVAFLTGLSLGYFSNLNDLEKILQKDRIFNPSSNRIVSDSDYSIWKKAVNKLIS